MSSLDDSISAARAQLRELTGPQRLEPLTRLAAGLMHRFSQNGPNAMPDLNEGIAAMREAYDYLADDDPARPHVSFQLGFMLSGRAVYMTDDRDREDAITHLGEGLAAEDLPSASAVGGWVFLGFNHLFRSISALGQPALAMRLMTGQAGDTGGSDVDRAIECFRTVLDRPTVSPELNEMAEVGLKMASAVRSLLGHGGGFDLRNMAETFEKLQEFQVLLTEQPGRGGFGVGKLFDLADLGAVNRLHPLDKPVAVVHQAVADVSDTPVSMPREEAPEPPAAAGVRDQLRVLLDLPAGALTWELAEYLLGSDAAALPADVVEEAVAMAGTIAELDDAEPEDWYLYAVALVLRDGPQAGTGLDALLVAARTAAPDSQAAVAIARSLSAFLDPGRANGGLPGAVAAGFAGRIDALLAVNPMTDDPSGRAGLHVLRCLCRASWAAAELRAAIDEAPEELSWLPTVHKGVPPAA
jgi:hypothetical protein